MSQPPEKPSTESQRVRDNWEKAIDRALAKPKPKGGWPKPEKKPKPKKP